jgi:hypothetical protein
MNMQKCYTRLNLASDKGMCKKELKVTRVRAKQEINDERGDGREEGAGRGGGERR